MTRRFPSQSKGRVGSRASRRGVTVLQFTLLLPILLLLTIAVIQFSILGAVEGTIQSAAVEGAEEAALGENLHRIAQVVNRLLASQNLEVTPEGNVLILVETVDPITGRVYIATVGNSSLADVCVPQGPSLLPHEVRVTVCAQITDSQGPVPDWLAFFGISLEGQLIKASSLKVSEQSLAAALH